MKRLLFLLAVVLLLVGSSTSAVASPLFFIENQGQIPDTNIAYYVQGGSRGLYFGSHGITLVLADDGPSVSASGRRIPRSLDLANSEFVNIQFHTLDLEFVGANATAHPVGDDVRLPRVSYFVGPQANWKRALRTYGKVVYRQLWPGIELQYEAGTNQMEYTFVVQPGADPKKIQMAYHGASSLQIDTKGQLRISTPLGIVTETAPVAYQDIGDKRVPVSAAFILGPGNTYGFQLGAYNKAKPLIIDPVILVFESRPIFLISDFFHGDDGLGVAVDQAGNAYVVGETVFFGFGGAVFQGYVVKVNSLGQVVYLDFLGGGVGVGTRAFDIAVDQLGQAYVVGATSASLGFPATVGPDLTYNGGISDAFIAKLDAAGDNLIYAGFLGGNDFDFGEGVAIDDAGNAYVTGAVTSSAATFPVKVGPDLSENGGFDVFICKIKANPSDPVVTNNLEYCGYIGGAADEVAVTGGTVSAGQVTVDAAGNAYISGTTSSNEATFPNGQGFASLAIPGPSQVHAGGADAFVAKVKPDGGGLVYAGYIGGSGNDKGFGRAIDEDGSFYITGITESNTNFPVQVGPDLTYNGGLSDAFVAKVTPDGNGLVYAGYIGGSEIDIGLGIAVDDAPSAHVVGWTESSETSFPVKKGPDLTFNGGADAFVAKVARNGQSLDRAGYIGTKDRDDFAFWIALDRFGNEYVTGGTCREATPVDCGVRDDTFLVKLGHPSDLGGVVGQQGVQHAEIFVIPALFIENDPSGCITTITLVQIQSSLDPRFGSFAQFSRSVFDVCTFTGIEALGETHDFQVEVANDLSSATLHATIELGTRALPAPGFPPDPSSYVADLNVTWTANEHMHASGGGGGSAHGCDAFFRGSSSFKVRTTDVSGTITCATDPLAGDPPVPGCDGMTNVLPMTTPEVAEIGLIREMDQSVIKLPRGASCEFIYGF